MPHSAFLAQLNTPVGSVEGQTQIRLGYAWGWILPNGWTFDQAIRFGTDREGRNEYALWAPSTVLRIPFGREKRWFTQVEYFGIMSQGKEKEFSKQFISTGLHYFITPNFEVGSIIAFGITEQSQGVLVNVGFGIRF
jgi:Putative MetA-pathway of phenol degradation